MFRLGPYELVREIAVGGMAVVHLAKVTGLGGFEKYVALKTIHPNLAEDEDFVQMLVHEAKLAVQLQHPNIAQTYDLGRVDDTYYMSMEHVDGIDVWKLMRAAEALNLKLPFDACAFVARDVAAALDHAHSCTDGDGRPLGIVHRDVSPQNVMITYDGVVKLLDFGIAKASSTLRQTAAGIIKGKFLYMSPEQAFGVELDGRSDIYAAGIVLYEMLTGRPIHVEDNPTRLLELVRAGAIVPPSQLRPGIPPRLEQITMHALETYRDERYQHAGELANDLHGFLRVFAPRYISASLAALIGKLFGRAAPEAPPPVRLDTTLRPVGDEEESSDTIFDPNQHSILQRGNASRDSDDGLGGDSFLDQHSILQPRANHDHDDPPRAARAARAHDETQLGIGPTTGHQFGKFTLHEQLGWNVLATVHHATFTVGGRGRDVALKRLAPQLADDTAFIERWDRELAPVAKLQHPNLVEIVEFGQLDRVRYVATELVDGTSLRKLMQRSRPAPIPIVLAIVKQLLDALVALPRGTAHGGVTPANVIIARNGTVRLAELGVARAMHGAAPLTLAELGYVAPETAIDSIVDERGDVFGMGVIAWELIAGRRLFGGRALEAVIAQLDELRIVPPSSHNVKCDGSLDRIVLAALARRPDERTPSPVTMRTTMQLFGDDRCAPPEAIRAWVEATSDESAWSGWELDFALDHDESKIIVIERDE